MTPSPDNRGKDVTHRASNTYLPTSRRDLCQPAVLLVQETNVIDEPLVFEFGRRCEAIFERRVWIRTVQLVEVDQILSRHIVSVLTITYLTIDGIVETSELSG